MQMGDYIVLAFVFLWLSGAILYMKKRRQSGKCIGCSGDCGNCHKK